MSAVNSLEKSLADVFKSAPKLPENGKKWLVKYLPWINVVLGALMLLAAWNLYHWAHTVNKLIDYANSFYKTSTGSNLNKDRLTVGIWLAIIVLVVQAVLYIAAFRGTRDRKKAGWNLMFYAALVNIVYGVILLFTDYGGVGTFIMSLIGSAIGLWLLFQIRSSYS